MGLLKGKRALITGGTSGLGKEIALTFAEQGADVAIMGTSQERAQSVLDSLRNNPEFEGQKFWSAILNVGDKKAVDAAVDALLKEWVGIDILVNSAGITRDTLFMKMSETDWDIVINTNLKSVYNLTQALIRFMIKARSGKIINIASVVGLTGNPGQVNYAASKLGMIGLTKSLAKELGARGINVNCIAPGICETRMTDVLSQQQRDELLKRVPMKRLGHPKDVADAAVFLASDMSNYITGHVLIVDGGMIA